MGAAEWTREMSEAGHQLLDMRLMLLCSGLISGGFLRLMVVVLRCFSMYLLWVLVSDLQLAFGLANEFYEASGRVQPKCSLVCGGSMIGESTGWHDWCTASLLPPGAATVTGVVVCQDARVSQRVKMGEVACDVWHVLRPRMEGVITL
eukprot:gene3476-3745_t